MQNISSKAGLKEAIRLLEFEHAEKGGQLVAQFHQTYESLKPVNLLRSTLVDISSSPSLISSILGTTVGLATGYLSKKMAVGASANLFRKLFGTIMQISVTHIVAQHPQTIKSIGQFVLQYILRKKESNSKRQ